MSICFGGIDPGLRGAIAFVDNERNVLLCEDFPITETPKTPRYRKVTDPVTGEVDKKKIQGYKREFDFVGTGALFDRVNALQGRKIILVERVAAKITDAATSAFTFGGSFWAIQMALADRKLGYDLVPPKTWQKALLVNPPKNDRKALRKTYLDKARKMFPDVDLQYEYHAEKAAALLIAEYCRKTFTE